MTTTLLDRPAILDDDLAAPDETSPPSHRRLPFHRLQRPPDDPRWVRPAVITLLVGAAVLYIWGLGASGWANSFYSAAAQAGSQSWKALFFGSPVNESTRQKIKRIKVPFG